MCRSNIKSVSSKAYYIEHIIYAVIGNFQHEELESLTAMLINCGYDKDLIYRFISNFLNVHINPDIGDCNSSQQDNISNLRPEVVFLNLPYLEDTTSKVRNTILGFIKRYDPLGIKLKVINIILYKCCTVGQFFRIKDKILLDMRANVICKITCSCGQMYIGETRRNIYTRMAEHTRTSGINITAAGQHLADNPGHSANTANPDVLASSRYNLKRKIKEALFIQSINPALNTQVEHKKLFLFNIFLTYF